MTNVKGTTEVVKTVAAKKVEEAKEAVKTVAKAVEAKAEEAKADAKAAEKLAETVEKTAVEPEKKTEAPAKAAKPAKKPGRKAAKEAKAAKKAVAEPKVYVQFGADESSVEVIVEKIKADFVAQGHRASTIKDLKVYLKPEDGAAYYVINEKVAGRVDLF